MKPIASIFPLFVTTVNTTATLVDAQLTPQPQSDVTVVQSLVLEKHRNYLLFQAHNQSSTPVSFVEFNECGNSIQWTLPSGQSLDDCVSARRSPSYKYPVLKAGESEVWHRDIQPTFFYYFSAEDEMANQKGLYQAQWTFTSFKNNQVTQQKAAPLYLWREKGIEFKKQTDEEKLGISIDKPPSVELDPADTPDTAPLPIPPAQTLPSPKDKGFSQTVAAVTDAPHADLAFLLLNGPDNALTTAPLMADQDNTFSVFTPENSVIVDDPAPKPSVPTETIKPGELKIWKVNIAQWFANHHLTAPGFYALTWTFKGQTSHPMSIYIPTTEEKLKFSQQD